MQHVFKAEGAVPSCSAMPVARQRAPVAADERRQVVNSEDGGLTHTGLGEPPAKRFMQR